MNSSTTAGIHADTARALLDDAQLGSVPVDDVAQALGVIGAGYAILAAADRMDAMVSALESLAATVDGLAAAVDAMATPRRRWWHRFTRVTVRAAESETETLEAAAAQQQPAPDTETADDDQGAAGVLFVGPWAGVTS